MKCGKLIAFEAIDAAGKATQSKLLAEKLGAELFSFPRYETFVGKAILGNLKGDWHVCSRTSETASTDAATNALVRQALFTVDRYDAAVSIKRSLDSGKNVVVDRFWASGLIYGSSDAVPADFLERIHQCLPQPDVWILLDITVEESFRRRPERLDAYERDCAKMEDVRERYRELFIQRSRPMHKYICLMAMENGYLCECGVRKWVIVDGAGDISEVHNRILEVI